MMSTKKYLQLSNQILLGMHIKWFVCKHKIMSLQPRSIKSKVYFFSESAGSSWLFWSLHNRPAPEKLFLKVYYWGEGGADRYLLASLASTWYWC